MSEPQFSVPLSALVHFESSNDMNVMRDRRWWDCLLCSSSRYAASESAARAAAVAHLESVHGIRAAGGDTQ